ncbi:hypothetical protein [Janthinobacterium psychrotolerans]|uniref:Uncharacterized protein n=1 Tax=Janthinobacterium psychrotolerans TaxID=1747903 RepID=A0A1A7C1N3_9BURK|nr:hypothetical protein [Janthinobacterium psychrotolerans]OBV39841.1 hypothetical protein ASR47_101263 [Janthinobacterium psychrotolerans]
MRSYSALAFLLVLGPGLNLTACGGGAGTGGTSSPTVTAPATPAAGRIAQIDYIAEAMDRSDLFATSSGLYLRKYSENGTDTIEKYEVSSGSAGWLSRALSVNGATFAPPLNGSTAGPAVYWAGFDRSTVKNMFGFANAKGIDDIGIETIVPAGARSTSTLNWAITTDGEVWLKSTSSSASNAKANYRLVAQTKMAYLGQTAAASMDDDVVLFASSGSDLVRVTPQGQVSTWTLPGRITVIKAGLGAMWVGTGDTIYRLDNDSLSTYAQVSGGVSAILGPLFCLSNNDIFTSKGLAYMDVGSGPAPTPRSYLSTSEVGLSAADMGKLQSMKGGMGGSGVFCGNTLDQEVYTYSLDLQTSKQMITKVIPI